MMYDELVKQLNVFRLKEDEYQVIPVYVSELIGEAAEAIEELSKYVETMRKLKCEGWYLEQTKYHDGYHAVSTMPLPQPPKEE